MAFAFSCLSWWLGFKVHSAWVEDASLTYDWGLICSLSPSLVYLSLSLHWRIALERGKYPGWLVAGGRWSRVNTITKWYKNNHLSFISVELSFTHVQRFLETSQREFLWPYSLFNYLPAGKLSVNYALSPQRPPTAIADLLSNKNWKA